jgi:hypothetical protein
MIRSQSIRSKRVVVSSIAEGREFRSSLGKTWIRREMRQAAAMVGGGHATSSPRPVQCENAWRSRTSDLVRHQQPWWSEALLTTCCVWRRSAKKWWWYSVVDSLQPPNDEFLHSHGAGFFCVRDRLRHWAGIRDGNHRAAHRRCCEMQTVRVHCLWPAFVQPFRSYLEAYSSWEDDSGFWETRSLLCCCCCCWNRSSGKTQNAPMLLPIGDSRHCKSRDNKKEP